MQYITNGVWGPIMEYRGVVGDVGPFAHAIDVLTVKATGRIKKPEWLRSHQEALTTDDDLLKQKRLSLCRADTLAGSSHTVQFNSAGSNLTHGN